MVDLFGNEKILALSWKEPYASLMLHGKIETRTWPTNYRGLVLICVSKQSYPFETVNNVISGSNQTNRLWLELGAPEMPMTKTLGKAIAVGRLVGCRKMTIQDEDLCFVQYREGLYCHIYENVRAIEPIAWSGSQGWKTVGQNIIDKIKFI